MFSRQNLQTVPQNCDRRRGYTNATTASGFRSIFDIAANDRGHLTAALIGYVSDGTSPFRYVASCAGANCSPV